jgi:hypothetical protein
MIEIERGRLSKCVRVDAQGVAPQRRHVLISSSWQSPASGLASAGRFRGTMRTGSHRSPMAGEKKLGLGSRRTDTACSCFAPVILIGILPHHNQDREWFSHGVLGDGHHGSLSGHVDLAGVWPGDSMWPEIRNKKVTEIKVACVRT